MLEVVKAVDKAKLKYKPSLVYTHSGADLNVDHRVVAMLCLHHLDPSLERFAKNCDYLR